jgi:glycosyltransferase involved in cell wall biosynthesis
MMQRVRKILAVFFTRIKSEVLHLWLMISSPEFRLIKGSGVFDPDYYLSQNPDLAGSGKNLLVHYFSEGEDELRRFSIYFERDYYLSQLSSERRDVTNPLVHFLQKGWQQGKKPNPLFHTDYYLNQYPDVSENIKNPLTYYLKQGWKKGHCTSPEMVYLAESTSISSLIEEKTTPLSYFLKRRAYSCFDPGRYVDNIPGLTEFTDDYWAHYVKYGAAAGKSPVALFDPFFYRQNNPGISAECLDLYTHFQSGKKFERLKPSKWFDPVFYLDQIPVHERDGMTPLEHYLIKGVHEQQYTDERVAVLPEKPLISIIVPVYNVNSRFLNNCIRSVLYQTYPHWELCLADDCSTDPHVRPLLKDWENKDDRIKVVYLQKNSGISEATGSAVELSTGEYLAFLDNDDELTSDALYQVIDALNNTGADLFYSDEDLIGDDGTVFSTFYKPDFNPELLLCHNYITHLLVTSADLFARSGGFLKEMDGAQDYDLVLKLSTMAAKVHHIDLVLYHWRASETSTSVNHQQKQYADSAGKRAVEWALERTGRKGDVLQTDWKFYYEPRFTLKSTPLVSIISVWRDNNHDGVSWIESLCRQTTYPDFEILVVLPVEGDHWEGIEDRIREVDSRIQIISLEDYESPTALYNNAFAHISGEYAAFVSPNVEIFSSGWIEGLLQFAQFEDAGFVGGTIAAGKGTSELSTVPDIANESPEYYLQWLAGCSPHMNGLQCSQEIMLVTGEFCFVRGSYFKKFGGLEAEMFPHLFSFADLSLKFRECGLRNIYSASCRAERVSLPAFNGEEIADSSKTGREQDVFQTRWRRVLQAGDPFYNPGCYREKNVSDEQFRSWSLGV